MFYTLSITIQFTSFQNNSVTVVDDISGLAIGGVFVLVESSVRIHNSYFASNAATQGSGGVIYAQSTKLNITASSFFYNRADRSGGVLRSIGDSETYVTDSNNYYEGNTAGLDGGIMSSKKAVLKFIESKLFFNSAQTFGGAIVVDVGTLQFYECEIFGNVAVLGGGAVSIYFVYLYISSSNFTANTVIDHDEGGGAVSASYSLGISISNSIFSSNEGNSGGVLSTLDSDSVSIKCSIFTSNLASLGGVIRVSQGKTLLIENCTFSNNSASEMGGIVSASSIINFTIANSAFESSRATQGGVVYATDYAYMYMQNTIFFNNAASLGMMYFIESTCIVSGFSEFITNIGSIFAYNSNVTIAGNATFINNSYPLSTNHTTYSEGGVITAFQSEIILNGLCNFKYNFAENGGAVYATESQVYITGNTTLSNNTAEKNGGAILLYQSELKCQDNGKLLLLENIAGERGGAIHAISSSIKTTFMILVDNDNIYECARVSQIIFTDNHAIKGGAISLEINAKLYIFIKIDYYNNELLTDIQPLVFERNEANYGGAIYVDDNTNSGICASTSFHAQSFNTECFLQVLSLHGEYAINFTYVNFTSNRGNISGADLYGGLLDRCTVSPFAEVYSESHKSQFESNQPQTNNNFIIDGLEHFKIYSNIKLTTIGSEPVRICFCNESGHPDCDHQLPPIQKKKGEMFEIKLVAVDQVGNPLSNVNILSSLLSNVGGLGINQANQTTAEGCTSLQYQVLSPHSMGQLNIHAEGPCKDAILSQRKVLINFTACECPIGFQPKVSDNTNCVCECDSKLNKYIKSCDFKTKSILRKGNPWISYISSYGSSSSGYLVYPHCPLDYCYPPGSNILINISEPNGSDAQCQHQRSGLLCGTCKSDFSLSLGTVHCVSCPHFWPALFVLQLLGSLVAGLVLVSVLLMLNLTVAVGTLNGIIFYANVLYNFIPSLSHSRITFYSVFVSWLNLELGFDLCFFKGMNAYSKIWIELLFPTYVIFLVIMIILVSEWSVRFSHLIGKKNPVATLATLILFSYTKLLNIIIRALSFVIVNYPGPTKKVQWLPDASVEFFRGKHIPLCIGALSLLFLCITFTALVFSWQWLAYFSDTKFLKLVKSQKMSHFIETYHAPHTPRNRYWSGLLLVVRIILYIASAINVSDNPNVNLLIIGLIISGMLFLKEITGINSRIYKKWPIEILETSILINIVVLCTSTLFTNMIENEKAKEAITDTSVAIVLLQFLGVVTYHTFTEIVMKIKIWKVCFGRNLRAAQSYEALQVSVKSSSTAPTSSVIDKPEEPTPQLMHDIVDTGTRSELREPLLEECNK